MRTALKTKGYEQAVEQCKRGGGVDDNQPSDGFDNLLRMIGFGLMIGLICSKGNCTKNGN